MEVYRKLRFHLVRYIMFATKYSIPRYLDGYLEIWSSKCNKWDKSQVPDPFRRVVTYFVKLEKTKTQLMMRNTKYELGVQNKHYRNDGCSEKKATPDALEIVHVVLECSRWVSKQIQRKQINRPSNISLVRHIGYLHEGVWGFCTQKSLCRNRQSVSKNPTSDTLVLIKLCGKIQLITN